MVDSQSKSLKNWIASAVESGKLEYAQELVGKLRENEALYAAFNVSAKYQIAEYTGKPLETEIVVKNRSR